MKRRFAKAKRYLARARGAASGGKASAIQAAVGGVCAIGVNALYPKVKFLQETWWATPALLGVAGHIVRKKKPGRGYGEAILGAAGYAFGSAYQARNQTQAQPTAPAETGALVTQRDTGALMEYDTGIAGYLDDAMDPTSAFYVEPGTVPADESSVAEAMGL